MKKHYLILSLCSGLISSTVLAHNLQLNQPVPAVSVVKDGEIVITQNDTAYQAWNSSKLAGKVRVVQHLAGRSSVKEKNEALMDAIRQAHFDPNKYQTTTIINADDAVIATGAFVVSSAKKGKKNNPHSQVILDQQSSVKKAWDLKEKESLILVLDKNAKVKFAFEGKLNEEQIEQVIKQVNQLVAQ